MKLIFKYFFISLLFLNGQLVHAQSFKIDSLKGKKMGVAIAKRKVLYFESYIQRYDIHN